MRAKRLVQEVMRLLSSVVSGRDKSGPIDTRVEEMTPVLQKQQQQASRYIVLAKMISQDLLRFVLCKQRT